MLRVLCRRVRGAPPRLLHLRFWSRNRVLTPKRPGVAPLGVPAQRPVLGQAFTPVFTKRITSWRYSPIMPRRSEQWFSLLEASSCFKNQRGSPSGSRGDRKYGGRSLRAPWGAPRPGPRATGRLRGIYSSPEPSFVAEWERGRARPSATTSSHATRGREACGALTASPQVITETLLVRGWGPLWCLQYILGGREPLSQLSLVVSLS